MDEPEALTDARLVKESGLAGYTAAAAHAMLAGFRALRRIIGHGIRFEQLTPALIIDFLKDEDEARRRLMAMPDRPTREAIERAIIGGLKSAIKDHGPIQADQLTSVMKRIVGQLRTAGVEVPDPAPPLPPRKAGRT